MNSKKTCLLTSLIISIIVSGCSSDDDDNFVTGKDKAAIIATIASDYSDSDIELVDLTARVANDYLTSTPANYANGLSDYSVVAYGEFYYRIGRYGIDTITKYSITNPNTAIFTYSTLDNSEDPTSNPYQLVFASASKAYLLRYNSPKIWIVNPSAPTEAEFKIGEIDLSSYDDGDGSPEISDGVIVDGKLFITLQRQSFWAVVAGNSYVAVIDTTTDTEIIVDALADLPGIHLQTSNPTSIVYQKDAGLFVQSSGSYGVWPSYVPEHIGGIERIFVDDYTTDIIVDDGDEVNHPYGLITNVVIISENLGYFIGYNNYGDNSLRGFNPSTGTVYERYIAELGADSTGDDVRGISVDSKNNLWVSIADLSNPRVLVIDTHDNEILYTIETTYNPVGVVFATVE